MLLPMRCPGPFEGPRRRGADDAKPCQRENQGADTDTRLGLATRVSAPQARRDGRADLARGPDVAEHGIEFVAQDDERVERHALVPARTQPIDHLRKPDALGITARHHAFILWRCVTARRGTDGRRPSVMPPPQAHGRLWSFTATLNFCLQPRYGSVVWMETCPSSN